MIAKLNRARHYIEHDVEWWTLLFHAARDCRRA